MLAFLVLLSLLGGALATVGVVHGRDGLADFGALLTLLAFGLLVAFAGTVS